MNVYGAYAKPHRPGLGRRLLLAANGLSLFLLQDTLRWNYRFENLQH